MFNSLIERLTGVFSSSFVVAAVFPVAIAVVLNLGMLQLSFGLEIVSSDWEIDESGGLAALQAGLVVVACALVVKSFSGELRRALEGEIIPAGGWIHISLRSAQVRRFDALVAERTIANANRREIEAKRPEWEQVLKDADPGLTDASTWFSSHAMSTAEREFVEQGAVGHELLARAVVEVSHEVARGAIGARGRWTRLREIIHYSCEEWLARELRVALQEEQRFGSGALALTAFGNVGESLRDYSLSRYNFHLDTFWSRLEALMPTDSLHRQRLEETKTTLDFMVASTWISGATTIGWLVALPFLSARYWLFGIVALIGPSLTMLCYRSAVEAYVSFAEVVRAAVDLHRLSIFDGLSIERPKGLREERERWDAIGRVITFGQQGTDFSYKRDSSG